MCLLTMGNSAPMDERSINALVRDFSLFLNLFRKCPQITAWGIVFMFMLLTSTLAVYIPKSSNLRINPTLFTTIEISRSSNWENTFLKKPDSEENVKSEAMVLMSSFGCFLRRELLRADNLDSVRDQRMRMKPFFAKNWA